MKKTLIHEIIGWFLVAPGVIAICLSITSVMHLPKGRFSKDFWSGRWFSGTQLEVNVGVTALIGLLAIAGALLLTMKNRPKIE